MQNGILTKLIMKNKGKGKSDSHSVSSDESKSVPKTVTHPEGTHDNTSLLTIDRKDSTEIGINKLNPNNSFDKDLSVAMAGLNTRAGDSLDTSVQVTKKSWVDKATTKDNERVYGRMKSEWELIQKIICCMQTKQISRIEKAELRA